MRYVCIRGTKKLKKCIVVVIVRDAATQTIGVLKTITAWDKQNLVPIVVILIAGGTRNGVGTKGLEVGTIVDVIIPIYQTGGLRAPLLQLAIDGVLNQTFKNWHLFLVDDCSTANVKSMVKKRLGDRVTYHRNKSNQLLPATLNTGHRLGRAPWIFWNADDDWKEPTFIENMLDCAVSQDFELVRCYDVIFNQQLRPKNIEDPRQNTAGGMSEVGNLGMAHFYSRDLWERVGGYDPGLFCIEDLDFWRKVLKDGAKVGWLPEALSNCCRHPESVTAGNSDVVLKAREKFKEKWQ